MARRHGTHSRKWVISLVTENTENARRRRTRVGIKRALRELAVESDPDKLTVSSLAERALISRKTFYLYYDSIEALYFEEQQELLDRYFAKVEETPEDLEDFSGHAMRFFTFLTQQDEYLIRLVCSKTRYGFGERLYEQQMRRYERAGNPFAWMGDEQELVIRFIRSTALEFFRNWVETGRCVDADKAANLLGELTESGVAPFAKAF